MINSELFRNFAYVVLPLGCIYPKVSLKAEYIYLYHASFGVYIPQIISQSSIYTPML